MYEALNTLPLRTSWHDWSTIPNTSIHRKNVSYIVGFSFEREKRYRTNVTGISLPWVYDFLYCSWQSYLSFSYLNDTKHLIVSVILFHYLNSFNSKKCHVPENYFVQWLKPNFERFPFQLILQPKFNKRIANNNLERD